MRKIVEEISSKIGLNTLEIDAGWDFEGTIEHYTRLALEKKEELFNRERCKGLEDLEDLEELDKKINHEVYEYILECLKNEYQRGIEVLEECNEDYI